MEKKSYLDKLLMMKEKKHIPTDSGWEMALELVQTYNLQPTKIDKSLSELPEYISSSNRRLCQFLFFGYIRNKLLIDTILKGLIKKEPRPCLSALLRVAAFELMDTGADRHAKVIHHAVEKAKKLVSVPESKLVNAVLRKVLTEKDRLIKGSEDDSARMELQYSCPKWLIDSWLEHFDKEAVEAMLVWNQKPASVCLRLLKSAEVPESFKETEWESVYMVGKWNWEEVREVLSSGQGYIQDPATRYAPELLNVKPGERVMDLCASPGGKSFLLSEALGEGGQLVAVDLPGSRIPRLRGNLECFAKGRYTIVESDVLDLSKEMLSEAGVPGEYDAILLDAPCSNTGVLKRRPDAKWRLEEQDMEKLCLLQLALLTQAVEFLAPGGRIVYSTCSIEHVENQGVVDSFLRQNDGYSLEKKTFSYPGKENCDGAAAFLIRRA